MVVLAYTRHQITVQVAVVAHLLQVETEQALLAVMVETELHLRFRE
jgi:hypothetical protein